MARRRMIDPNIWESEDFSRLSLLARLVFIGMFSNADDEGRGRAKPVYLKSILFPYDDGMRLIDMEKALSEIGSNMSVTLYTHNDSEYYAFNNWHKWQRVDKPQPSKIPPFTGDINHSENGSGISPELVENGSRLKEKKRKEKKDMQKENVFTPPTLEEIKVYCAKRKNNVNPQQFYDFYTSADDVSRHWIDSKGNPVLNWKQKIITWEGRNKEPAQAATVIEERYITQEEYDEYYGRA